MRTDTFELMMQVALVVVLGIVLAVGQVALNQWQENKCEQQGGEYFRSLEANRSLCKKPNNG